MKQNLTRASDELFKRPPDECFHTLDALAAHCERTRDTAAEAWPLPSSLRPVDDRGALKLDVGSVAPLGLSDWSFSQLCAMCGVSKPTINRLTPKTAGTALLETLPPGDKPIQLLTTAASDPLSDDRIVRSVHGTAYTRLWNAELLDVVCEFDDFKPPASRHENLNESGPFADLPARYAGAEAVVGDGDLPERPQDLSTGLYCGEQDMFAFLIDPDGWVELDTRDAETGWSRTERFAPGFFVWNSEVGRRSLGVQTFWYQHVCRNHIVWDAVEVAEFSRKHTANVRDGLGEIRQRLDALVARRDERRDAFASTMKTAMETRFAPDATREKAVKALQKEGIPAALAKQVVPESGKAGTLFDVVDKLARLTGKTAFAGDRAELDAKIGRLLALAV